MSKILLLSPPISLEQRYGKLAAAGNTMPSLGLLNLAAAARKDGHQVHLIEAAALALPEDEVLRSIRQLQPDAIGITSTTLGIVTAASLAQTAKSIAPQTKIILGGPHVSALPEETLRRYPAFDIACVGEGEMTLVELLRALDEKSSLHAVDGLVYRPDPATLSRTSPRAPIENLDALPMPAWDLLPDFPHRYQPAANRSRLSPAASLVSTRGCPNQCIFCDRSVFGMQCRGYSTEYFMAMVRELQDRWNVRELLLEDDTFFVLRRRLLEICEAMAQLPRRLSWSCLGRVQSITPEILRAMKRAGCWQIAYGIESGSQKILDFERKRQKLEEVERAVRLTREAGILAKGFFILGHPLETEETLEATARFSRRLALDDVSVFFMTPFPGSLLYEEAPKYGQFDSDWTKMNLLTSVFVPNGLTRERLEEALRDMLRRFYLRPRIFWSFARRCIASPRFAMQFVRGALSFLRFTKKAR